MTRATAPVKTGRTIQFYRRDPVADEAAEALGYRVGKTREVPMNECKDECNCGRRHS